MNRRSGLMAFLVIAVGLALTACSTAPSPQMRAQAEALEEQSLDPNRSMRMAQRARVHFAEVAEISQRAHDDGKAVIAPKMIHSVAPVYPFVHRRKSVQGLVWIGFFVDEEGVPRRVTVMSEEGTVADPLFGIAAGAAVQKWRFSPATLDGRPVPVAVAVPVLFVLQ